VQEFKAGHVVDAANLELQGPSFAADVAALDPAGRYVVYCQTGIRAAAAAAQMREVGLDVLDGGSMQSMLDAGWPRA